MVIYFHLHLLSCKSNIYQISKVEKEFCRSCSKLLGVPKRSTQHNFWSKHLIRKKIIFSQRGCMCIPGVKISSTFNQNWLCRNLTKCTKLVTIWGANRKIHLQQKDIYFTKFDYTILFIELFIDYLFVLKMVFLIWKMCISLEEKWGQKRVMSYLGAPKLESFVPMEYFHAM